MSAAGLKSENLVHVEKHRTESGIVHQAPVGKVERRVVIVDDILDTGATLVSACEKLVAAGAEGLLYLRDAWIGSLDRSGTTCGLFR
jgi:phosphoribosylpyrophosphate synthetase